MNGKRGERLLKALKILKRAALTTAEFLDSFSTSRLTIIKAWNTRPIWEIIFEEGAEQSNNSSITAKANIRKKESERRNYNQLLRYLSQEGLTQKENNSKWLLTAKGNKKLEVLEKEPILKLSKQYPKEVSPELKIIIFDIPEKERWKRNWLRSVLQNLGFTMLQKSVWIGKNKIPIELLQDLQILNLLSCVEVFVITKQGSLRTKRMP